LGILPIEQKMASSALGIIQGDRKLSSTQKDGHVPNDATQPSLVATGASILVILKGVKVLELKFQNRLIMVPDD
jgi:hypothetical protein